MNKLQIAQLAQEYGLINFGDRLAHNYGRRSITNPSLIITKKTTKMEIYRYSQKHYTQDTQAGIKI